MHAANTTHQTFGSCTGEVVASLFACCTYISFSEVALDVRSLSLLRRLLRSLHWSNELEARLATLQAKFVQLQAKSIQEMRANLHDSTRVSRRTPSEGFIAHGASLLRAVLQYQKDEVQLRLKHNTMTASVRQLAASVRSNEIQQHRQSARILMLQKRVSDIRTCWQANKSHLS